MHIAGGNHFVKTANELGELVLAVVQKTKGSKWYLLSKRPH